MEPRLEVTRTDSGLAVAGELDLATTPQLSEALDELSGGSGDIVLDVAELSFIDSTGLRALLGAIEGMPAERRLILRGTQPQVIRVFEISGILGKVESLVVEGAEETEG